MLVKRSGLVCLLGSPGVGKSTQGAELAKALEGAHLSVGDLVREANGILGRSRGQIRPSVQELIVAAGADALDKLLVLDGFPRSPGQVAVLDRLPWECLAVIVLDATYETCLDRMLQRARSGEDLAKIGFRLCKAATEIPRVVTALNNAGYETMEADGNGTVAETASVIVRQLQCRVPALGTRGMLVAAPSLEGA